MPGAPPFRLLAREQRGLLDLEASDGQHLLGRVPRQQSSKH
jgi:hypothetical protein